MWDVISYDNFLFKYTVYLYKFIDKGNEMLCLFWVI